jgi:Mg-chelatase subunit ChlD
LRNIERIVFYLLVMITPVLAFDKTGLDIDLTKTSIPVLDKSGYGSKYLSLATDITEVTLLRDGYFTFGTTGGLNQDSLEKNCQLTFGHPYALTSYPYFSIDGDEKRIESYFYDHFQWLYLNGDTLWLRATDYSTVELFFDLILEQGGSVIRADLTIKNLDTEAHNVGVGVLFDPALGKWGDGAVFVNEELFDEASTFLSPVPSVLTINERKMSPYGLGMQLGFPGEDPMQIDLGNWYDLHNNQDAVFNQLYDLALLMQWQTTELAPGESRTTSFSVSLLAPDFPDGLFLRANLPSFFSIENNQLFPRITDRVVEVFNNGSQTISNVVLELNSDALASDWESPNPFTVQVDHYAYATARIEIPEIFEDRLVHLTLNADQNSQTIDAITQPVFIPSAPFSDSGLEVVIDSVATNAFPDVDITFRTTIEQTGQIVTDLAPENVFLYEDQSRIQNFILDKDTADGANQADIVFVLDVTGSMGNEIDAVKDNIVEFTDSLSLRQIDFRLGMVTFLDIIENVYDFTSSVPEFQAYLAAQFAHGGGDYPENSLDALMAATEFEFRPNARRIIIWITDARYHIDNSYTPYTPQDVVNEMLGASIVTHCIGNASEQTDFYDPITIPTGGSFYDINGNFQDILLEISRIPFLGRYKLSYTSAAAATGMHFINLEIHYAGLGGFDETTYTLSGSQQQNPAIQSTFKCFPNPFNPAIKIAISNPGQMAGEVTIFNVLGQKIQNYSFAAGQLQNEVVWSAINFDGNEVGTGFYFVVTRLFGVNGQVQTLPVQKIIYAK